MKDFWQSLAVSGIVVGIIVWAIIAHGQQQRAERGTLQWDILIDRFNEVRVLDTTGVCLYVYITGEGGGIAAVPKTQLPAGTGCQ